MAGPDVPKIPVRKAGPSMLYHALRYLERGWSVVPVRRDKKPYLQTWQEYQGRKPTEREVRGWWAEWPDAGVAVITGKVSGLMVLDADGSEGLESAALYIHGDTMTATTGGGGKHYYFNYPSGNRVPNAVRFLPGLDCRGDGGYVVAPPSPHKSGRRYSWDSGPQMAVDIPPDILSMLRGAPVKRERVPEDISEIPKGRRDDQLTRLAGRVLRAGFSATECSSVIQAINTAWCKPPLQDKQVEKIVQSISGRERKRREGTQSEFTVLTQRDMLRKYGEDETRWTVSEWLPEASCGLVVAPPGNYKTWLLMALAFSISTGRPFLGKWPVLSPGPVLFIQQEDPWGMLQGRLGSMFTQKEPSATKDKDPEFELDCTFVEELDNIPLYWYTDRQLRFSDKSSITALERRVASIKPKVVIIDPLYTAADSKDYMAEGAQKMAALKIMRDEYECSFVIAHHTTVAGSGSEDRSTIWGSQFLNAWLEFGWRVPEGNGDSSIVVRHFKTCENPKRLQLIFKITDFEFSVSVKEDVPSAVDRVEEIILTGGGKSVRAIAEEAGVSKSTVQRILKDLKEKK